MSDGSETCIDVQPGLIRTLVVQDGAAAIFAVVATLVVQLGTYVAVLAAGAGDKNAVLATMAVSALWIALASPLLAAGSPSVIGAFLRGGIAADASAITLLILWITAKDAQTNLPIITFVAAIKCYCTLAAVALAGIAIVRCPRLSISRHVLAVTVAIVFVLILAGPIWIGGLLAGDSREIVVSAAVYANPFYSMTAAMVEQTGFVWHVSEIMYSITRVGDYISPPQNPWLAATIIYLSTAILASSLGVTLRRFRPATPR